MKFSWWQIIKYGTNGLLATTIHYLALFLQVEKFGVASLGFANGIASVFGITASFLGNRYFVFEDVKEKAFSQAWKFVSLYVLLAIFNYGFMYYFGDVRQIEYTMVFLFATALQFVLSYVGNKLLVFK